MIRRVVVCEALVPFVTGGAELLVRSLIKHLSKHGYETELVRIPFKEYPKDEILPHATAWRLIDLSESNGRPIDLVIATKFPTYFVRHPHKVAWVLHQCRSAYELCGTKFSDFTHTNADVGLRDQIINLDRQMLSECRRLFTNAQNTANRMKKFNGLDATPLYHPPPLADRLLSGTHGNYVIVSGRLESIKRVDLTLEALPLVDRKIKLIVTGDGSQRKSLERKAEELNLGDRVTFTGQVSDEQLIKFYAEALAVIYMPYDEDYGYVTLEAFLAHKPVITTDDSGGVMEFVKDGVNGIICDPEPEAIATAVNELSANRNRATSYGDAGFERARTITWDGVIEKLVGE